MKVFLYTILTAVLLTAISFAQTNAQGSASGSQDLSVSQSGNGANAQSDTSAQGTAGGAASSPSQNHSTQASTSNQASSDQSVSSRAAPGKTIHATLEKPIDARKNKPGDEVVAKTTQTTTSSDGVAIPKGSKIIGHVTEAKAKQKGESQSAVGVVFDHAVLKNGQQIPMNASIQAISANTSAAAFDDQPLSSEMVGAGANPSATAGRGAVGGVGSVAGAATNTVGGAASRLDTTTAGTLNGAASLPNGAASSTISSTSHGVSGLNGLSLSTAAQNSTEGSVISSANKNVHLDSGTEMILQVAK
jgi:hypothetical protein